MTLKEKGFIKNIEFRIFQRAAKMFDETGQAEDPFNQSKPDENQLNLDWRVKTSIGKFGKEPSTLFETDRGDTVREIKSNKKSVQDEIKTKRQNLVEKELFFNWKRSRKWHNKKLFAYLQLVLHKSWASFTRATTTVRFQIWIFDWNKLLAINNSLKYKFSSSYFPSILRLNSALKISTVTFEIQI